MSGRRKWFEVDHGGLAEIAKRRGMAFIITEPVQNAWDEDVTRVDLKLEPVPNTARALLTIEDDAPDGFKDLTDSFMMFRSSRKLDDPEKRGRFNVGEKLLLAVADDARVMSTTGTVIFGPKGRTRSPKKTERGSILTATLRMTRTEYWEALDFTRTLIPPPGVETWVNGEKLPEREHVHEVERRLDTEVRGEEGGFTYKTRQTWLRFYELLPGEKAHLYEMGIPVDELDCPWHVEVGQKVPLSVDRGSVRYGYVQKIEAIAAEAMASHLSEETSREGWVTTALPYVDDDDAVRAIIKQRFGDKAVVFDPSAPEANKRALDAGYKVIHGGELPKSAWGVVRRAEALLPAGRLFNDGRVHLTPHGVPEVPKEAWTWQMRGAALYAQEFAEHAVGFIPDVTFYNHAGLKFAAFCGGAGLAFNMGAAKVKEMVGEGYRSGEQKLFDALLIHEVAHFAEKDHLTDGFYTECCRIGAAVRDFYGTNLCAQQYAVKDIMDKERARRGEEVEV